MCGEVKDRPGEEPEASAAAGEEDPAASGSTGPETADGPTELERALADAEESRNRSCASPPSSTTSASAR